MKTLVLAATFVLLAGCATSNAKDTAPPIAPTAPPPTEMMSITAEKTTFSARSQPQLCDKSAAICSIDTVISSTAVDNGELLWERRIYFQTSAGSTEPLTAIPVTVMKRAGKKILRVQNARGDSFELDVKHGHMKKPKEPREYKATAAKP